MSGFADDFRPGIGARQRPDSGQAVANRRMRSSAVKIAACKSPRNLLSNRLPIIGFLVIHSSRGARARAAQKAGSALDCRSGRRGGSGVRRNPSLSGCCIGNAARFPAGAFACLKITAQPRSRCNSRPEAKPGTAVYSGGGPAAQMPPLGDFFAERRINVALVAQGLKTAVGREDLISPSPARQRGCATQPAGDCRATPAPLRSVSNPAEWPRG
jgi:hypothetical protein